jgi:hypothetical protein
MPNPRFHFSGRWKKSYLDAVQAMATAAHCGELDVMAAPEPASAQ